MNQDYEQEYQSLPRMFRWQARYNRMVTAVQALLCYTAIMTIACVWLWWKGGY